MVDDGDFTREMSTTTPGDLELAVGASSRAERAENKREGNWLRGQMKYDAGERISDHKINKEKPQMELKTHSTTYIWYKKKEKKRNRLRNTHPRPLEDVAAAPPLAMIV